MLLQSISLSNRKILRLGVVDKGNQVGGDTEAERC